MHSVSTNTASAAAMARPGTKRSAGPGPGQTGITRAPWRESGPYAGYVIRRLIAEYRAAVAPHSQVEAVLGMQKCVQQIIEMLLKQRHREQHEDFYTQLETSSTWQRFLAKHKRKQEEEHKAAQALSSIFEQLP